MRKVKCAVMTREPYLKCENYERGNFEICEFCTQNLYLNIFSEEVENNFKEIKK